MFDFIRRRQRHKKIAGICRDVVRARAGKFPARAAIYIMGSEKIAKELADRLAAKEMSKDELLDSLEVAFTEIERSINQ